MAPKPEIPIVFETLKQALRAGLSGQESRAFWWPILPALTDGMDKIESDMDVVGNAERLQDILKESTIDSTSQRTSEKDVDFVSNACAKIGTCLVAQGKVGEIDLGYWMPLMKLIVWQVKRLDLSYWTINSIIDQGERYGEPTPTGLNATFFTFREMCRTFMPKTYTVLKTIGALEDKYLSLMFVDFFVEIFPPHILLPILDAYFLEGVKIMYRYGLALISGYKGHIKAGKYNTAKEFWLAVKSDGVALAGTAGSNMVGKVLGIEDVMQAADAFMVYERAQNQTFYLTGKLKENAYDVGRSILAKMSRPMKISKTNIRALERAASLVEAKDLRSSVARKNSVSAPSPVRSTITEKAMSATSEKAGVFRKGSTTKMGSRSSNSPAASPSVNNSNPASPISLAELELAENVELAAGILEQSEILDKNKATKLLTCLPDTVTTGGLQLCYASYRDGWEIGTLYGKSAGLRPVVILFKLQAPYEDVILGATIGESISPADEHKVRGEGRTSRIFRVDSGGSKFFQWQGLTNAIPQEGTEAASYSMFCVARADTLLFGSSLKHGCNALRVDSDLKILMVGPSDTFGDEVLVGEQESGPRQHQVLVQEIEVFCGAASKAAADREQRFEIKPSILG